MALMILPDEPEKRLIYSLSHDVAVAIVEIVGGERYADYLTCKTAPGQHPVRQAAFHSAAAAPLPNTAPCRQRLHAANPENMNPFRVVLRGNPSGIIVAGQHIGADAQAAQAVSRQGRRLQLAIPRPARNRAYNPALCRQAICHAFRQTAQNCRRLVLMGSADADFVPGHIALENALRHRGSTPA